MARRPQVRYWETRKAYCCTLNGKQHTLAQGPDDAPHGPTYQAAVKRFGEVVCLDQATVIDNKDANTLHVILEKYLAHVADKVDEGKKKASTLEFRQTLLLPFVNHKLAGKPLGEVQVKDLVHAHLDDFLAVMKQPRRINGQIRKWKGGTLAGFVASMQAGLNWAVKTGLITRNPIKGYEGPAYKSRGREALLGKDKAERQDTHKRILEVALPSFRPFIICLHATGCRPGELRQATAADWDDAGGCLHYHAEDIRLEGETSHKTGSKGKERVIVFQGEALQIMRSLVAKYPTGPLFRYTGRHASRNPKPWTIHEVARKFRVIREKLAMPNLTPYSYRHTFCTQMLENGMSIDQLCELVGNSPMVLRKHYKHLLGNKKNLRAWLEKFTDHKEEIEKPATAGV